MVSFSPRDLKHQAKEHLNRFGSNARQLIFFHSGLTILLILISNGLNIYLDNQIDATGGLSGLGTRSILQTLQTMIQLGSALFTPFWTAGLLNVAMNWAAGQPAHPKDLFHGFRRFFAVLGHQFHLTVMTFFFMTGTGYAAGFLFTLTPYSDPLVEIIQPMLTTGMMDFSNIPLDQLASAYLPFVLIWMFIFLPLIIYYRYSVRLGLYFLLTFPGMGVMRAMANSTVIMRGKKMQMFKLDLSFWWYYALEVLLMIVCFLDGILPVFGITLPFNPLVGYFFFLGLYCVLQLLLHMWKKAEIQTAYVLAYQHLSHPDHMDPPQ